MKNILTALVMAAFVAASANFAQAAIVGVDNWGSGSSISTLGTSSNQDVGAGIRGGSRDTSVSAGSGFVSAHFSPVTANTLVLDSGPGSTGSFTSVYNSFGGGLNVNFVDGTNNAFVANVIDANGTGTLSITVEDTSSNSATVTQDINDGDSGFIGFAFSKFAGVDLENTSVLTLTLASTGAGGDFTIGSIQAVPEPASLGLMSLGSLLILRRRRRNRA